MGNAVPPLVAYKLALALKVSSRVSNTVNKKITPLFYQVDGIINNCMKVLFLFGLFLFFQPVSSAQTTNEIKRFTSGGSVWLSGRVGGNPSGSSFGTTIYSDTMKIQVDVDLPVHNVDLRILLCKELYGKRFTSIENLESFGKYVMRKWYSHPQIGDYSTSNLCITSRCLSFLPDRYYSFAYHIEIDKDTKNCISFIKNMIYDVKDKRFLKAKDLISAQGLKILGVKKVKEVDISLDSEYLYVGVNNKGIDNWAKKILLSDNNRELFTAKMAELVEIKSLPGEIEEVVENCCDSCVGIHPWSSWDNSSFSNR